MIKAALIDMDGILYDSMPFHTQAWRRMMLQIGIDRPVEEFFLYEGMTGRDTIKMLGERELGKSFTDEECAALYEIKSRYFAEYGEPPMIPGALDTLRDIASKGINCVLVTGSGQKSLLEKVMKDYANVFHKRIAVTSKDVKHGKPHPEPYLKGAKLAGVLPDECLAFENAPLGIKSASEAGAYTIGITTGPLPADKLWEAGAKKVFGNFYECKKFLDENLIEL